MKWELRWEPYKFYDHESGWYFKVLILPRLWKLGPDLHHQGDEGLFFSLGPLHLSINNRFIKIRRQFYEGLLEPLDWSLSRDKNLLLRFKKVAPSE